ncbi:Protein of unknown function [Pyronema omphalodes CBS 100304]|uniref:Uncharacterized protein n=1 Tax=Pyronema omphalodes (strain CBS 100304) TaxID=1076935 RepID=U4L846_PYROM|nr:Protein of unknown function [Pyronema omphalodes CBS 100304]
MTIPRFTNTDTKYRMPGRSSQPARHMEFNALEQACSRHDKAIKNMKKLRKKNH